MDLGLLSVDLPVRRSIFFDLVEFAGNMRRMTIQHGRIAIANLTRMIENYDLGSKLAQPLAGLFLESEATYPRLISLTDTFLILKPTLSPGTASGRDSWCISTDLTSVERPTGAKVTTMPGLITPVSTRPTGTVPMPPIL